VEWGLGELCGNPGQQIRRGGKINSSNKSIDVLGFIVQLFRQMERRNKLGFFGVRNFC